MKSSAVRFTMMLCFACKLFAEQPKPLLMVMEQNPWLSVIGSDCPVFAIYSDGTMVYQKLTHPTDQSDPYLTRKTEDAEKMIAELLAFDIKEMPEEHMLTYWTDAPTTLIWTPAKTIGIYGDWRELRPTARATDDPETSKAAEREKKQWETLPKELRAALVRVDEARKAKGTAWLPASVEVMLWPHEKAPDPASPWPAGWPGLRDKNTLKRGEDSFSVYLPSEKLDVLRRFLSALKENGAVLIDGKKMAAAIRFPFPGEDAWMKPPH
jgi:hypothetical protein